VHGKGLCAGFVFAGILFAGIFFAGVLFAGLSSRVLFRCFVERFVFVAGGERGFVFAGFCLRVLVFRFLGWPGRASQKKQEKAQTRV
jgi:hypothetical protein